MKTFIPDTKRFRRELSGVHKQIFRSTLFPPDKLLLKGSQTDKLVEENGTAGKHYFTAKERRNKRLLVKI
ncbi:MAG: hypothetical protein LBH58_12245 [Tannerellaceae bacterium]|nr:hypothetical protein [Tannerellaceae bacterium]